MNNFKSGLMLRRVAARLFLVATLLCLLFSSALAQRSSDTTLTNNSIVKLVKAGFKEKTIISIINSRPNRFNVDTEQLIQLKRSGVSENIILAMLSLSGASDRSDEDWADDSFFRGTKSPAETNGSEGGADIFGSSSGSKSRSQSRGAQGGVENEGNITGSATVRIIRPPSEANGPLKMEKTPTLDNEGVIRLVDAGFSEGTIIKRIEESPVDFDLSTDKIAELHKRRVSDPIIAAMTTAMSDGPAKPPR
ncbi:MAG TPA: hypothetical protein VI306_21570 [Pyrinomonadaceae bacterium]